MNIVKRNILALIIFYLLVNSICTAEELPDQGIANVNLIVTDITDQPIDQAEIMISSAGFQKKGVTDKKGYYSVKLPKAKTYDIVIKKYGSKFVFNKVLEIPDLVSRLDINQPLKINLVTKYIKKYTLTGVFFYENKAELKPESNQALNELFSDMKKNNTMVIEIAGHTDDTGDDKYNLALSQKRADAVKQYLIQRGIEDVRITTKGYGETSPIVPNSTELDRERNRRVEVRIIKE